MEATHLLSSTRHVQNLWANPDWTARQRNKSAIAGTVASFGTWSVDEATNTLVTSIEGNLFPNDEGRDQRRIIALEGDQLKMVNPSPGSGGRAEIVFRRAK
jgi:hypothetical protein